MYLIQQYNLRIDTFTETYRKTFKSGLVVWTEMGLVGLYIYSEFLISQKTRTSPLNFTVQRWQH